MDSPAPGGLTPFPDHCHCGIRWFWRGTFFLGLSLGELLLLPVVTDMSAVTADLLPSPVLQAKHLSGPAAP